MRPEVPKPVRLAQKALRRAVKRGTLIRPDRCEQCQKECKPDGAHWNYDERLRVRWLCKSCHKLWDIADPKDTTGGYVEVLPRDRTHCPQRHEFTPENTTLVIEKRKYGYAEKRRCKTCSHDRYLRNRRKENV